ncbi:Crp/Fnr family transcriptional regulator [Dysgonomonas sp. HDW5A]|uniref:Crp/Fnr family transcriptional regulator n=1 Tax=Dysgonomonas sp. HDW5A TaxID=2714926 RepID=UPI001409E28D|nr:Crp/Fnr family transcriptional regulator [Dysgonomonas sp. HDW5A]QIK59186.1 Crp/Fnr family transcriptional regulator [Dysgonomonas sp. HDW5A]
MKKENLLNLLRTEFLESIDNYSEIKSFAKGDFLFRQENICKNLFWIKKGICRRYYLHNGKEITTEFLFADDFIVSSKSFVLSKPTDEFAETLTNIEALVISQDNFNKLKTEYPELANIDYKKISERRV